MRKSRDLPTLEFLKVLQNEFIIAEFRSKIHFASKDYYRRVMDGKRAKIEDISLKNNLPNIFNDNSLKEEFYKRFYPEWGMPLFEGTDSKDFFLYFRANSPVQFKNENGEAEIGLIKEFNDDGGSMNCLIKKTNDEEINVSISKIRRIL